MRINRFPRSLVTLCVSVLLAAGATHAIEPLDVSALTENLDTLIDQHPTAERTTITLKVIDLETGDVLYDRGGGKLLIPASNLKIYTAAAALDLLGPEYRWTTSVSGIGAVKRGVCTGDLIIHGTGDPMLDTEQLAAIADSVVKDHKLKRVNGAVAVETGKRWLNVPIKGPGWMWDDEPDYYNMSIRSLMLNFNTIKITVTPGDKAATVRVEPPSSWPPVAIIRESIGQETMVRFDRDPFEESITVTAIPEPGSGPVSDNITMHDPTRWIASVFRRMLEDRGVEFLDQSALATHPRSVAADGQLLASHEGKTLAEALRHFLKVSENAVGEMVLLKLAETQTEGDVSWPAGAKVITDWLVNTAGLEEGSFRLVDGSGLSRYNLISADSSVRLLAYMKSHEHFQPFFDGLPVYKAALLEGEKWGGVPLAEFDPERVFAKTGGMSGVSTISGYIKTLDGRWLAFSLLANGYIGSNKPVIDLRNAVWSELVRYRPAGVKAENPVTP